MLDELVTELSSSFSGNVVDLTAKPFLFLVLLLLYLLPEPIIVNLSLFYAEFIQIFDWKAKSLRY